MSHITIPLPESLNHCGCAHAELGMHVTTCVPARAYEAAPLRERDGYQEGASFRAVSWQYPLRLSMEVSVEVEVDPAAYIAEHRAEFDEWEMEPGYDEWEKPIAFLMWKLDEGTDVSTVFDFEPRHVARTRVDNLDCDHHPRWTPEATAAISKPTPDPNQGVLL